MADSKLDQVVKGTPPPNTSLPILASRAAGDSQPSERTSGAGIPGSAPSDPTQFLPSSPPQIYLNLLILEASLRQQFLTLRSRRRQHSFVVFFLSLWLLWFTYAQFLRPREDGTGVGGSVYWIIDVGEKVALIGGVVMGILFKVTGQWERGVRWPRRWLGTTNRGLRSMNLKIVVLKGPWWKEMVSTLSFLLPLQLFFPTPGSSYHYIDYTPNEKRLMQAQGRQQPGSSEFAEEDVAPGGDHVKILLLPKQFTPEFRENWETYRSEYWILENTRRSQLRMRIRTQERAEAKAQGGWLWWTGWRGWSRALSFSSPAPHHVHGTPHHVHSMSHTTTMREKHRRGPSVIKDREGSHSRSSSRSSNTTGTPELEDRERRWSTASTGSVNDKRRRSKLVSSSDLGRSGSIKSRPVRLTPARDGLGVGTSTTQTSLRKQASTISSRSTGSDSSEGRSTRTRSNFDGIVKLEPED